MAVKVNHFLKLNPMFFFGISGLRGESSSFTRGPPGLAKGLLGSQILRRQEMLFQQDVSWGYITNSLNHRCVWWFLW